MTALPTSPPAAGRPSSSLHFAVGEMSGKLDQIMATILPQIADLKAMDAALDNRLSTLERDKWVFLGVIAAGGALWAVLQTYGSTLVTLIKAMPA